MVLRCDLCRIEVPDERVFADHTSGKRHQALLNARQRFETSQNSSVYISRIKAEHDDRVLKHYFSRFGSIKNCFIDKEKHVYAIIEYEQVDSANNCLAHGEEHQLTDGTRLKVKQRRQQEFKSKRMLVSEEEFLNLNKEKEIEQHAAMLHLLNQQSDIDEQAQSLVEQEKITADLFKSREDFFRELQNLFRQHFPEAKLALIGSMVNGLATSLSDMDLVLILNDTYLEPQRTASANSSGDSMNVDENSSSNDADANTKLKFKRYGSDESSTRSISPLCHSADELLQMSVADRLDYFRSLLRTHAAHVCHVQRIIQARCPVLRFCHKKAKIFCELSINNHLAVANTELIQYLMACEPKLRPLLFAIRLWIKQKDLLGRGHRFNTYTLFWMIVVSMQINQQQLPSIQSLSQRAERKRQHGPWDCSVPTSSFNIGHTSTLSIKKHLEQFFTFYSTFNGSLHELSPWAGSFQAKTNANIPFSIFDPFEHDHNLSANISEQNWLKFQEECLLAKQILHEAGRKRQTKAWGLSLILTRKSLPSNNYPMASYSNHSSNQTVEWTFPPMDEQEFDEKFQYILKEILLFERIDPETIRKKRPVSPMEHQDLTTSELAEQLDETLTTKRRRINDEGVRTVPVSEQDQDPTVSVKEKCFFQAQYRTWQDRRKIKRNIDHENTNMPTFERERLISLKLKEDQDHQLKTPLYLSMESKFISSIPEHKVQIYFHHLNNQQTQYFADLMHFLTLYLPKMLTNSSKV